MFRNWPPCFYALRGWLPDEVVRLINHYSAIKDLALALNKE